MQRFIGCGGLLQVSSARFEVVVGQVVDAWRAVGVRCGGGSARFGIVGLLRVVVAAMSQFDAIAWPC